MMVTREATPADGVRLMAQMPPERRAGFNVEGFADHLAQSRLTWAGVEPDGPPGPGAVVNIGGVMDSGQYDQSGASIGYAWQVIDPDAVQRNRRAYLRQGRQLLALAHRLYPHLSVVIEPGNAAALRHALRMGWRFVGATVAFGARALVFERTCNG